MTELMNTSNVYWKGDRANFMYYKGEQVWHRKLEAGEAVTVNTPTLSTGASNQTPDTYLSNLNSTEPVGSFREPKDAKIYVGARDNYNSLSLHLVSGNSLANYNSSLFGYGPLKKPTPSDDMMFTVDLPGEKDAAAAAVYSKDHNIILQYGLYSVGIYHGENKSYLQTPAGKYFFTFPVVLNKVGRIGTLTMRIAGGLSACYLDKTLLKRVLCERPPADFSENFIVVAQNMSYTYSWTTTNVAGGGPAISSFSYYTGEQSRSRGKSMFGY